MYYDYSTDDFMRTRKMNAKCETKQRALNKTFDVRVVLALIALIPHELTREHRVREPSQSGQALYCILC